MYMDDFWKKKKKKKKMNKNWRLIGTSRIYSLDVGMEFDRKLCQTHNQKWKKTNNGSNRTNKSRKTRNAWRKGNLQVLWNIESGQHQTCEDERKNKKSVSQMNEKTSRNQALQLKTYQREVRLVRYSGRFFKWTREELCQINQRTRKLMSIHKALKSKDDINHMYQKKMEEENLSALSAFCYSTRLVRSCGYINSMSRRPH